MFECSLCRQSFEESERYGKRTKRCKPCYKTLVAKRRTKIKKWLKNYKESNPCMDCGKYFHFTAMQFDHLPDKKKLYNISHIYMMRFEAIKEEIDKCELVCANCHAVRTYQRRIN